MYLPLTASHGTVGWGNSELIGAARVGKSLPDLEVVIRETTPTILLDFSSKLIRIPRFGVPVRLTSWRWDQQGKNTAQLIALLNNSDPIPATSGAPH